MLLIAFLGLSIAETKPTKGFRLGVCSGAASNCYLAQLHLTYNHDQFAFTLGAGVLSLGLSGKYYYLSSEGNMRHFVSASYAAVGFPGVLLKTTGDVEMDLVAPAYGISFGADFHLLESKKLIVTPQIGADYAHTGDNGTGWFPSLSSELSYAF